MLDESFAAVVASPIRFVCQSAAEESGDQAKEGMVDRFVPVTTHNDEMCLVVY